MRITSDQWRNAKKDALQVCLSGKFFLCVTGTFTGGINPDTTTPCARGAAPLMDISGSPLQCVYEKDVVPELCPPDHFCHVGTDAASTVCCPIEGM